MEKQVLWEKVCGMLREALPADIYDRWIAVIQAGELTETALTLQVTNDFYCTWLEENYVPLISDAVTSVLGRTLTIGIEVNVGAARKDMAATDSEPDLGDLFSHAKPAHPEPAPVIPAQSTATIEPPRPSRSSSQGGNRHRSVFKLNGKYTFETFVVGSSNDFAHAAALAVGNAPARAYNPLFLYGGVGLGKTHLMQAIGNHAISRDPSCRVCYLSSEAFTNEYIDALQNGKLTEFRKRFRNVDILLIDDIQFLAGKERLQEEFFHTFNALFDGHKQIVLTCDRPASEIPGLERRLVSRFEWGLVTEIDAPEFETRMAILRKKAEMLDVQVSDDVIRFIAERIAANVRRLEGALVRAASFASLTNRQLNAEALERLLRDTLDDEAPQTLTMERIQRAVAEYYDIRFSDILSRKRPANIAVPRQIAMYLCRDLTPHSLPAIGEAFGKNHATVLHACRLITKKEQEDPALRKALQDLRDTLTKR